MQLMVDPKTDEWNLVAVIARCRRTAGAQLAKFSVSGSGCWVFSGQKDRRGYGRITLKFTGYKLRFFAHRLAYAFHKDCDPGLRLVCHHCDNPGCINPEHLFLGSPADNVNDMISKGRKVVVRGDANGMAKLTEDMVAAILAEIRSGKSNKAIAKNFPVTHSMISNIRRGKSWAHLQPISHAVSRGTNNVSEDYQ